MRCKYVTSLANNKRNQTNPKLAQAHTNVPILPTTPHLYTPEDQFILCLHIKQETEWVFVRVEETILGAVVGSGRD